MKHPVLPASPRSPVAAQKGNGPSASPAASINNVPPRHRLHRRPPIHADRPARWASAAPSALNQRSLPPPFGPISPTVLPASIAKSHVLKHQLLAISKIQMGDLHDTFMGIIGQINGPVFCWPPAGFNDIVVGSKIHAYLVMFL